MDGIQISQVSKKYNGQFDFAVNRIDLTIPAGTITGLLGPNASKAFRSEYFSGYFSIFLAK